MLITLDMLVCTCCLQVSLVGVIVFAMVVSSDKQRFQHPLDFFDAHLELLFMKIEAEPHPVGHSVPARWLMYPQSGESLK